MLQGISEGLPRPSEAFRDRFSPERNRSGEETSLALQGAGANPLRCGDGALADRPAALSLGRIGALEVRIAASAVEIDAAMALRYRVFFEEGGAIADAEARLTKRDRDRFDAVCDHLLVVDHGAGVPQVVATCRLLRQSVADANGGFYSASEFDVGALARRHAGLEFLELGRSCVAVSHRGKRTAELLWQGIWAYSVRYHVDVMIGCGSLDGTDPDALALPLAFLHQYARAPEDWRTGTAAGRHVAMDRLAPDAVDPRVALRALPPLLKGYLRLGAFVGEGAVVDHDFGTTDVLIILPVAAIAKRYVDYYGAETGRRAA
jgi:putative hemolysin